MDLDGVIVCDAVKALDAIADHGRVLMLQSYLYFALRDGYIQYSHLGDFVF